MRLKPIAKSNPAVFTIPKQDIYYPKPGSLQWGTEWLEPYAAFSIAYQCFSLLKLMFSSLVGGFNPAKKHVHK